MMKDIKTCNSLDIFLLIKNFQAIKYYISSVLNYSDILSLTE